MVHSKREEDTERDNIIPEKCVKDKDSAFSEVGAWYNHVKVMSARGMGDREKDR